MTPDQEFHAHLEKCEQCEKNPYNLCPTGHALLMATGNGPMETLGEQISPEEVQVRINRQISQLRAKDPHKLDCTCAYCRTAWHAESHWPALLWELPRNTRLFREQLIPQTGQPESFKACGCESEGLIRICQTGDSPGAAVTRAWVAYTLASKIFKESPISPFAAPGSTSVH